MTLAQLAQLSSIDLSAVHVQLPRSQSQAQLVAILPHLPHLTGLTALHIREFELSGEATAPLAAALRHLPTLQVCALRVRYQLHSACTCTTNAHKPTTRAHLKYRPCW